MAHPYGVLPGDLAPSDERQSCRHALGKYFSKLPDEAILGILGWLSAKDLARLSTCSKAFYVYANTDELYKALLLEVKGGWS